jgi:CRP-like cAMP-binding protein/SAM-dependent methyltransferase
MAFLDQFDETHQHLLRTEATRMELDRGEILFRRGEPGGDVYLVAAGGLEIVDRRATPEVILAVAEAGTVVGEMAFVDASPRSADVRANGPTTVLRWAREDLQALLDRQPALASRFFQEVARLASFRMRQLNTGAVTGGVGRDTAPSAGTERMRQEVQRVTDAVKTALLDAETRLRQDPTDEQGHAEVVESLDRLQDEVRVLYGGIVEDAHADEASRLLTRELHPYLVRSALADRCIRRTQGVTGSAEVLAHVLVDAASGDGQLGELMDRWLLDRPMLRALREGRQSTVAAVLKSLPEHRNRRVLLINAGTGSLVAALNAEMGLAPTVLTVIDQSRDALAFLDAGVAVRPKQVELQTLQENLVQLSLGRSGHRLPKQDVVVIHGMVEYMPDRIALSLLRTAHDLLVENGKVVVSAMSPSDDRHLLDRLLGWPTVRRQPDRLERIIERAGLQIDSWEPATRPLLLAVTTPR